MTSFKSIEIKDSIIMGSNPENSDGLRNDMEEANQAIKLFRQFQLAIREDAASYQRIEFEELIVEELKNIKKGISNIEDKLEEVNVFLKPGITGELVLSKGFEIGGSGVQVVTTIPLAEIQYSELQEDLEKIKGKATGLSKLPERLINKIMDYICQKY